MGFPRIISKNNKIYTKLGEFCLSCDGSNFWIICHTCQEELQTQDHFWKHIQDEHNFLHSIKQENSRHMNAGAAENVTEATILPLPLYRKMSEDEPMQQQRVASVGNNNNNNNNNNNTNSNSNDEESQEAHESKHYTEMRGIDPSDVEIDIKVEPPSLIAQNLHVSTSNAITQSMYQLPHQAALNPAYSTVVHSMPSLAMPALAPLAPPPAVLNASLLSYELQHQQQQQQQQQQQLLPNKNETSTTASASSAVSSDDGERWYICDFESCGLKFKYQSRLELHRSVHSKERRFSCDLCGASFKQSCNLSTHRKKKHFIKGSRNLASHPLIAVTVAQPIGSPQQPQQMKFE